MNMADRQDYDLHTLQEEAIRRAREMQARAQIPPRAPVYSPSSSYDRQPAAQEETNEPPPPPAGPAREDPPRPRETRHDEPPPDPTPFSSPLGSVTNLFDVLTKDGDRSLILVLMLILMEDKADPSLLFALMYLLL